MPLFLAKRASHLTEAMDGPDCDPALLERSYHQFRAVNGLLSRSRFVYKRFIRPLMSDRGRGYSLLDIGFGGGDIARGLARWAQRDGLDLCVTGIDIDPRAYTYVQRFPQSPKLSFRLADVTTLVARGERFDFVLSNHVLHHLDAPGLQAMLDAAQALGARVVVFNDIRRSALAYLGFWLLTAVAFRRSYIRQDGLISIRRSYTAKELRARVPAGWEVLRAMPFRLLLIHRGARESA
ncbi:MAG: methyltransferase domain-containing protein [Gammaproteobacteria bacterium]|nr:methyltransferase domain-containing protein [Gammaproteobacteria bacterium]